MFNWCSSLPSLLVATATEAEKPTLVLTAVLLTLAIIYFTSKVGAELSRMANFPPVLGELVGGVIIGVSALSLVVFPESVTADKSLVMNVLNFLNPMSEELFTKVFESESEVISVLAELGVVVLLFEIGLESDIRELKKVGIKATIVAVAGVTAPFAMGTAGLIYFFHFPAVPAIFAGAALTATSIGITSKVLSELGWLKSKEGQIIIGAAVIDDILGIIILAVVASLAKTGEVNLVQVLLLIVSAVAFLIGSILLGSIFNKTFEAIVENLKTRGSIIIPAFIFALLMAFLANAIHLEAILGSFAAGLVLDETDARNELDEQVKPIADVIVPLFFVTVGARVDLGVLNPVVPENREGLYIATFLITVAIIGKIVSGWSFLSGEKINRLGIGIGMIPRGEVGLVFAGIGASSGVLTKPLEAAIIIMVIITTFLAPPLLKLVLGEAEAETETQVVAKGEEVKTPF
ncbi:MAG: cation:proton antiporter [Geminocystis sp.]|nr:cation:proton antiporter [Geminocystis sp.]HIK37651.1 cation:proton antiporter [Geminocystis sp. M7585_C2015_104]MCS7147568.1 cation:proton antiporter [Geminocystis sp.]MCX8077971.1 cation:proton antiporter [Geminocystis sp.]MDW8115261.1 cation:proton antiporter [Geminocystis sp.]